MCGRSWVKTLAEHEEDFIDGACCPIVDKSDLTCGAGSDRFYPRFTICKFSNGKKQ